MLQIPRDPYIACLNIAKRHRDTTKRMKNNKFYRSLVRKQVNIGITANMTAELHLASYRRYPTPQ